MKKIKKLILMIRISKVFGYNYIESMKLMYKFHKIDSVNN